MFSSAYQRQWANLVDLLKKKILLLSREEDNKELSKCSAPQKADVAPWFVLTPSLTFSVIFSAMEILNLQMDVERLRQLMSGSKTVVDTRLRGEK